MLTPILESPHGSALAEARVQRRVLLFLALGAVATTQTGTAVASGVGGELEVTILGKALTYSQSLKAGKANVLLVTAGSSGTNVQLLADAFRKAGTNVKMSAPEALDAALARWADAAYVPPGQLTASIRELCTAQKMLSMSGSVNDVEAGRAAMAVGVNNDKPQLVVNLARISAEGHKFSARLLKLARIVG